MLDEMETVTELHRKRLIWLMRGTIKRRPRSPEGSGEDAKRFHLVG